MRSEIRSLCSLGSKDGVPVSQTDRLINRSVTTYDQRRHFLLRRGNRQVEGKIILGLTRGCESKKWSGTRRISN